MVAESLLSLVRMVADVGRQVLVHGDSNHLRHMAVLLAACVENTLDVLVEPRIEAASFYSAKEYQQCLQSQAQVCGVCHGYSLERG